MPQKCAGMRIEPAPSLPWCSAPYPAADAAPAPAEEAPALYPCFQGLCVMPVSGQLDTPVQPNSDTVVLPSAIPPAAYIRATAGESSAIMLPLLIRLPVCMGMSLAQNRSLIVKVSPCSGPSGPPDISAASALRA